MADIDSTPGSVVLFSNGIAITADDLDFGDLSTKDEINRMSSFSQMVNDVPNTAHRIWAPTGIKTWDVYDMILTQSTFGTPRTLHLESTANVTQSVKGPPLSEQTSNALAVVPRIEAISSALEANGFVLPTPLASPMIPSASGSEDAPLPDSNPPGWRSIEPRDKLEIAQSIRPNSHHPDASPVPSTGVASQFLKLQSQLAVDAMLDTRGNTFYSTPIYPSDFSSVIQNGAWRPFEISPQPGDLWLPVPNGGKITGEMLTVVLERPWWNPTVFSNTAWQFSATSGLSEVSNGSVPGSGLMPMFCSALLIAKNVQTIPGPGPNPSVSSPPFTLSQLPTGFVAPLNSGSPAPGGLMIFGFVCNFVPKCPNPNPALRFSP